MIKNYMEVLVKDILNEVIKNYKICKCEKCLDDIQSIALNNLGPVYFLSHVNSGEKTAFLLDRQRRITVLAKVIEAIELVSKNEHNNKNNRGTL